LAGGGDEEEDEEEEEDVDAAGTAGTSRRMTL
jgi:hypothetical protein